MPNLSIELHFRWFERVVLGNLYVDIKDSALVAAVMRPKNFAFPVHEILTEHLGLDNLLSLSVLYSLLEILNLLHKSSLRHYK